MKSHLLIVIFMSILLLGNLVQAVSVEPRNILVDLNAGDETVIPINITMLERKPQSLYIETNSPYCLINGSQNATLIITQTLTIVNITIWSPANSSLGQTSCTIYWRFPNISHAGGGGGGGYHPPSNETQIPPQESTEPTNETPTTPQPTNESQPTPTPTPPTDETSTKPSQEVPMMIIVVVASIIILAGYFMVKVMEAVITRQVMKPTTPQPTNESKPTLEKKKIKKKKPANENKEKSYK